MVQLIESDILTKEILDWKGVHLFHFMSSACSQKTRICLNLKKVGWESHPINLAAGENYSEYYLGINPRGLVPTLVIDGEVHIESNDILMLLDERFPNIKLIPDGLENDMATLLRHEDDLHMDLRTLTFRYTQPRGKEPRSKETLQNYRDRGSGTVQGKRDAHKDVELNFWESAAKNGITNEAVRESAGKFKTAIDELGTRLQSNQYLLGDEISCLDVAWIIYINRLIRCSYPLDQLHPRVSEWFWPIRNRPEFANELKVPPEVQKAGEENQAQQQAAGEGLAQVAGFM